MWEHWVELDLGHLENFAETLETLLAAEQKQFDAWAAEEASTLPKEKQEEFYDIQSDQYWLLSDVFPNILRQSFFVTCYSLLESRLLNLCIHIKKEKNLGIGYNHLKDKGIFAAQTYLKKVAGISFPDQNLPWQEVLVYNRIRNIIVHDYGKVDPQDEKIHDFIKRKKWIRIDNIREIKLLNGFHTEVIGTLRGFVTDLINAIP